MAKVKFSKKVKYNGTLYPAYTTFECDDKDERQLVALGAVVIQEVKLPPDTTEAVLGIVGEDTIVHSTIMEPQISSGKIDEKPKKKTTKNKKSTKK